MVSGVSRSRFQRGLHVGQAALDVPLPTRQRPVRRSQFGNPGAINVEHAHVLQHLQRLIEAANGDRRSALGSSGRSRRLSGPGNCTDQRQTGQFVDTAVGDVCNRRKGGAMGGVNCEERLFVNEVFCAGPLGVGAFSRLSGGGLVRFACGTGRSNPSGGVALWPIGRDPVTAARGRATVATAHRRTRRSGRPSSGLVSLTREYNGSS